MKRSSFLKSLPFIFAAPKVLAEITEKKDSTAPILKVIGDRYYGPTPEEWTKKHEEFTEQDLYDFLTELHAPSNNPRTIYLTKIGVSVRKDMPGLCADGFGGEFRQQTEREARYIRMFARGLLGNV